MNIKINKSPLAFHFLDTIDYSKVINENCGIFHELSVSTNELHIESSNINKLQVASPSSLKIEIGN